MDYWHEQTQGKRQKKVLRATRTWAAGDSCQDCPNRPFYPEQCYSEEPQLWRTAERIEGTECSMLLVNEFEVYFKAWNFLEMNFMPSSEFGSGWTDQLNYWIEAFNIIGPEIKKYHDDLREEIRQKNGG